MNAYQEMLAIKKDAVVELKEGPGRLAVCPDMGGRVFAELNGVSLHRLHLETVRNPTQPFNNYGGANFWPAPEGGKFGFNYQGDQWYVQPAINNQPFAVKKHDATSVVIEKRVPLINRKNVTVDTRMSRAVSLAKLPRILKGARLAASIAYQTTDTLKVLNEVSTDDALLAGWTLEQFDTTDHTIAFCAVDHPQAAINFDFYQHPGDKIAYHPKGFTYRADGQRKGQIGIRKAAQPAFIGCYDLSRRLLILKENRSKLDGLFFNIADNEQAHGPYSAEDVYSIFTSDPDMRAFELETIGPLQVKDGRLKSSKLVSATTFAIFEKASDIESFVKTHIGT